MGGQGQSTQRRKHLLPVLLRNSLDRRGHRQREHSPLTSGKAVALILEQGGGALPQENPETP